MEGCLFCKIAAGEIPRYTIAENEDFVAYLDIAPITKGHTLVVPKQHCVNMHDFPAEKGSTWFAFVQDVMEKVKKGVSADGLNVGTNNGEAAGQVVMHLHTHIIPRFAGDGLQSWPNKEATPEELEALRKKITGE